MLFLPLVILKVRAFADSQGVLVFATQKCVVPRADVVVGLVPLRRLLVPLMCQQRVKQCTGIAVTVRKSLMKLAQSSPANAFAGLCFLDSIRH